MLFADSKGKCPHGLDAVESSLGKLPLQCRRSKPLDRSNLSGCPQTPYQHNLVRRADGARVCVERQYTSPILPDRNGKCPTGLNRTNSQGQREICVWPKPRLVPLEKITSNLQIGVEVLDCFSVDARTCDRRLPKIDGLELCNIDAVHEAKKEGNVQPLYHSWKASGRHDGVYIAVRVIGDRFSNKEAESIFHIRYSTYSKSLDPDLILATRAYCAALPSALQSPSTYDHCVCGIGPGDSRKEVCHVYENGKLVRTEEGRATRCN